MRQNSTNFELLSRIAQDFLSLGRVIRIETVHELIVGSFDHSAPINSQNNTFYEKDKIF